MSQFGILFTVSVDSCTEVVAGKPIEAGVCGEHGHCVSLAGGSFRCACHPGYTGKFCQESKLDSVVQLNFKRPFSVHKPLIT